MTLKFSSQALCSYMYIESIFIAEATIPKQEKNNKNLLLYVIAPITSSSAGYREKQFHKRMIDSHLA